MSKEILESSPLTATRMENIARVITIRFGGTAYFSNYPMRGHEFAEHLSTHTLSTSSIGVYHSQCQSSTPRYFEELLLVIFEKEFLRWTFDFLEKLWMSK